MKRVFVICMLVAGMVGSATTGRAQFLKNLVNNVTQKIGNKAAGNAAGTTGKPDSASSAARTARDSAALAQMMAGSSKPKVMTAADSAAVKSFMTATGGSGMLYQYRVAYDFKRNGKDSSLVDTMSSAYSTNGYTHVDMDMLGMRMQLLGHTNQNKYTVVLYPESKSYLLNTIDTAVLRNDKMTYTVTRIGAETVAGYSCVHAKLTIVTTGQKTPIVEDIWTSTAVPGYEEIKKLATLQNKNISAKMLEALDNAGCGGYPVKMTMQPTGVTSSKDLSISMDMVLITAARRNFPASEFEIPAGYTPYNQQSMMQNIMAAMPKQK
jgi:hypothetical protein